MDEASEIEKLRNELKAKEQEIEQLRSRLHELQSNVTCTKVEADKLSNSEIARYSRQLILSEVGVSGQIKLKRASVLIVGAGGLGCPVALYLATAGIGKLGIVDYDEVEISNLHRQVLHQEYDVGISKAKSVVKSIQRINSSCVCIPYNVQLSSNNALSIIKEYDIVVDATDNVATRYLLNDACVLTDRPLVSGSALRLEGQLTVYHYEEGPCYRCLFPNPPPPEAVTNCAEGGVIGMVPGIIGCIQALEVLKILVGLKASYKQKLLIVDGQNGTFKVIKLRPANPNCCVCGKAPSITALIDYEQFCGVPATDKGHSINLLTQEERLTCKEYKDLIDNKTEHLLIDVRPEIELDICSLPNSFNIPIDKIDKNATKTFIINLLNHLLHSSEQTKIPVVVVCRRGHDSQLAVKALQAMLMEFPVNVKDLKGGLHAWAKEVDKDFPVY